MVFTAIDLSDNYETIDGDERFGAGGTATGGYVESVEGRYEREWLHLKDDRKVRGYDLRSEERRDRDFVDPEVIVIDADTTESDITDGGVTLYETDTDVSGTVGEQFDNVPSELDTTGERNAYIADLPNRGEAY